MNRAVFHPVRWLSLFALTLLASCSTQTTSPVVLPTADSLALSVDTLTVTVQSSVQASVTAWDSLGHSIAARLTFTSSDPAVFTVNGGGRVFGQSEGTAMLYVQSGAASDSAVVVVAPVSRGWYAQSSGAGSVSLHDVFVMADGRHACVVGAAGKVLVSTNGGATWSTQVSGTASSLEGVWFTASAEGWACGKSGVVIHTTNGGAGWTRITVPASEDLEDVQFTSRDTGYVVGRTPGVVLRTLDRGQTWHRLVPTSFGLHSVSFAGHSDGWAVGDGGVILGTHDAGASWYVMTPFVTSTDLEGVWRASTERANAVGSLGATVRVGTPDSVWTLANVGATYDLRGVCFPTLLTGFAVGSNGSGVALRSENGGATWSPQITNTAARLNAVFFVDAEHGWAVGENGVVLHTATSGMP